LRQSPQEAVINVPEWRIDWREGGLWRKLSHSAGVS
jgi:hypothetical protein